MRRAKLNSHTAQPVRLRTAAISARQRSISLTVGRFSSAKELATTATSSGTSSPKDRMSPSRIVTRSETCSAASALRQDDRRAKRCGPRRDSPTTARHRRHSPGRRNIFRFARSREGRPRRGRFGDPHTGHSVVPLRGTLLTSSQPPPEGTRSLKEACSLGFLCEADDGPRTRDLRLGKPTLYQLSYVRVRGRGMGRDGTILASS